MSFILSHEIGRLTIFHLNTPVGFQTELLEINRKKRRKEGKKEKKILWLYLKYYKMIIAI